MEKRFEFYLLSNQLVFDPEKIILGGSVVRTFGHQWVETAQRMLLPHVTSGTDQASKVFMKVPRTTSQLPMAQWTDRVGLIGAGALVYHTLGYM